MAMQLPKEDLPTWQPCIQFCLQERCGEAAEFTAEFAGVCGIPLKLAIFATKGGMRTIAMLGKEQVFGLILFSASIVLTQARVNLRQLPGFNLRKRDAAAQADTREEIGELILPHAFGQRWKRKHSQEAESADCELEVENCLNEPILLCWVSPLGELFGFRRINDCSIKDKSVSNKHIEYTYLSHSFVCIKYHDKPPSRLLNLSADQLLFHYTPTTPHIRHTITVKPNTRTSLFRRPAVEITLQSSQLDGDLIDTTTKIYVPVYIAGWKLMCEPNVFQDVPLLEEILTQELSLMRELFPAPARCKLQESTPIWLNKSLVYGSKTKPVDEQKAMYHPVGGANWLKKHGLSVFKEGCVEICNATSYLRDRELWGQGGILVHEYSHAYHDKFCTQGYDNPDVLAAYKQAMAAKLYDCVAVHGPQGVKGPMKHYACSNHMEFFAELSVAYLFNQDECTEYNKWFPFNRCQLRKHDPDTCAFLERMWNQE
ncbi:hypothetical protein EON65_21035 [archaeon]|nr:MAG: hypothetical protein EON65_21035 [archaeon]